MQGHAQLDEAVNRCRNMGMSDEQTETVCLVVGATPSEILAVLAPYMQRVSIGLCQIGVALGFYDESERPDFAAVLSEPVQSRSEKRAEQRLRSMRKHTGKPWDGKRGRHR